MSDLAIYKFHADFGRMGSLSGIFSASKQRVADVMGKVIYFGEVLGRHSEIYGPLEAGDITLVTDDPEAVAMFDKYELATGWNPLSYVQEENQ